MLGSVQGARTPPPRVPLASLWWDSISQGTPRRTGAWPTRTRGPVLRAVGGGGTMDSPEVTFTLAYLVFAVCFVFTPTEFHSAGLTVQNLLSGWLGSEDAAFVPYHQRRTAATLFCHSLLPLGEAPPHLGRRTPVCWSEVVGRAGPCGGALGPLSGEESREGSGISGIPESRGCWPAAHVFPTGGSWSFVGGRNGGSEPWGEGMLRPAGADREQSCGPSS